MTAIIETTLPGQNAPDLAALRSDYDALQQHAADVTVRHNAEQAQLERAISELREMWSKCNAELIEEYTDITTRAAAAEKALREAVIAAYRESGQKQLGHGLSVQVRTKFVYDEAKAVEWAAVYAPICVKQVIDAKTFETICKNSKPEFVTVNETPIAVIKNA